MEKDSFCKEHKQRVGPYQLSKMIGKGHYASVYKAHNSISGQVAAIKVL